MKRYLVAFALIAVVCVGGYAALSLANPVAQDSGPPAAIMVGLEPNQANSLIYIADENGHFAANGLAVTLKNYSSGAAAADGLLAGEADVAMATEWVLAGRALEQRPVVAIASIDRFEQVYLLGRTDRGIRNATDLKGRTIGLPRKTSTEFYLGRFLNLAGIGLGDVAIVDVPATHAADALANGTVDAVVAWRPYAMRVQDRMRNGSVVWPAQSGQPSYCTAVTTTTWLSGHPETARRFLSALARAEADVDNDSTAARAIVGKRLNYESAYLALIWPEHRFALSLDESLVAAMQDEARWKVANNLTNATAIPDFTEYISTTALASVNPPAVRIIGGTGAAPPAAAEVRR
ncbi:MAG: ABC transporter substrate-binding protein [Methanospirillum sp.]